ncbi:MAG: peptidoglycan DD-metalloendopeptidase family protein [Pseudomonadota bacterium]
MPRLRRASARSCARTSAYAVLALSLAACDGPLDFDLRGATGGFTTADAAANATADRPRADDRGVISYPNYQVAVARRGDTIADVAERVGLPAAELARFNGIELGVPLRQGEVVALPRRVAEPSPATGAAGTGPIQPPAVDVTELAGRAIDAAPDTTPAAPSPAPAAAPRVPTGEEPVRHRVERGETAFTIARLYQVPVRALAEWNGLGSDFAIREGQFLLIPTARSAPPAPAAEPVVAAPPLPGAGSPTPTPPSAAQPLPEPEAPATVPEPTEPSADVGETTVRSDAEMGLPVQGTIIRAYAKGRNEGIDIQAAAGAPVKAAQAGTVAAITRSSDGVPIIVVRHDSGLLTVYANVTDVNVAKDDAVRRGQSIARLRAAPDNFVHFEVRDGFDSVDPERYLGG